MVLSFCIFFSPTFEKPSTIPQKDVSAFCKIASFTWFQAKKKVEIGPTGQ